MTRPTVSGIYVDWTFIKTLVDNNNLMVHYTEDDKKYNIQIYNGPTLYKTTLIKTGVQVGGDGWDQQQNDTDRTDFLTNYAPNANGLEKMAIRVEDDVDIDVNIISEGINKKLRYDQLTKNQTISNSSYTTIYTYTGKGKAYGAFLKFSDKRMELKITIDSEDIMVDFDIEDLPKTDDDKSQTPFIHRSGDKEIHIEFPGAVQYTTDFIIAIKGGKSNKKLSWGYVVLTKEI